MNGNKVVLVLVTSIDENILTKLSLILNNYQGYSIHLITPYEHIRNWFAEQRIEFDNIGVAVPESEESKHDEFVKIMQGPFFHNIYVPGTDLLLWKTIAMDRLRYFFASASNKHLMKTTDDLKFDILVCTIDLFHPLTHFLERKARREGLHCIGFQINQLRCKEALDSAFSFNEIWVDTSADKEFLIKHKGISPTCVHVFGFESPIRLEKNEILASREKFKKSLEVKGNCMTMAIFFSLRHIWETRRFFGELVRWKTKHPKSYGNLFFYILPDSDRAREEFDLLFAKECQVLGNLRLHDGNVPTDLIPFMDILVGFRYSKILEEIANYAKSIVIIFDPYDFNRTHFMCLKSNRFSVISEPMHFERDFDHILRKVTNVLSPEF